MSKQMTAVEWLEQEFIALQNYGVNELGLFAKAIEMEKQQMDKVAGDWFNEAESYMHDGKKKWDDFEDYYNTTFNK
jgi:hypothetical protein